MSDNILTLFRRTVLRRGDHPCLHYKEKEHWKNLSWIAVEEKVRCLSLGLAAIGLKAGEKVCLLSETRLEWTLCDLAILSNRAVTVPIYPSLSPDQAAYIIEDSQANMMIIEKNDDWRAIQAYLKDWKGTVILIEDGVPGGSFPRPQSGREGEAPRALPVEGATRAPIMPLEVVIQKGKSRPANLYDENLKQIVPDDLATIVYTSGTTGPPKGGLITHRNIVAEVEGLLDVLHFGEEEICLMSLPLSHVLARANQYYQLARGCQLAFAEGLHNLGQNMKEIRPHFMLVVPRLLEKSHEKIMGTVLRLPLPLRKAFQLGLVLGKNIGVRRQRGLSIGFLQNLGFKFFSYLLFRKIRRVFGGRMRVLVCGGAPLCKEIAQFFLSMGMLVLEGYGLTETCAAITINRLDDFRFGTVGKPIEGVRIRMEADNEICVKGDMVFDGYYRQEKATQEVFDSEGWFHTGDIGEFTKDGFLKITDRKKDIIATSGGKKIAPQNIENILQQSHYIQQAFIHGDRRKFLSALITLNWEGIEEFARSRNITFTSRAELARCDAVVDLIQKEVDQCNRGLSNFESIKKFAILDNEFSIEAGELTPTMKMKRKVISAKYHSILDQFYRE